ncbi:hypothetical protein JHK87_039624 [Glycine soja]|nr:hypothetical protein JHK87_039624 [Glycine soja]
MVKHKDESTKFLLRDRECAELIGQSANEVNRVKIEACSKVDSPNLDCNDAPQVESPAGIQPHIVSSLSHMLDEHNVHAKSFRMARDRLADSQVDNIRLKLIAAREKDGHVYNLPNVPEVVALIVGDFDPISKRDIIVETQHGELQRIHQLPCSYLGLQYPLLFPYGEDGYRVDILHCSMMPPHCSYFLCIYVSRKFSMGSFLIGKLTGSSTDDG